MLVVRRYPQPSVDATSKWTCSYGHHKKAWVLRGWGSDHPLQSIKVCQGLPRLGDDRAGAAVWSSLSLDEPCRASKKSGPWGLRVYLSEQHGWIASQSALGSSPQISPAVCSPRNQQPRIWQRDLLHKHRRCRCNLRRAHDDRPSERVDLELRNLNCRARARAQPGLAASVVISSRRAVVHLGSRRARSQHARPSLARAGCRGIDQQCLWYRMGPPGGTSDSCREWAVFR